MRKVLCVEFSVFERIIPLTSGYLQAFATTDHVVRTEYKFGHYTTVATTPEATILRELIAAAADVYAFSCYVWNMRLVKRAVDALRVALPRAQIILGGPQVMRQAEHYLDRRDENTVICNGEGELAFTNYLRELTQPDPELCSIDGISFYRSGELITTPTPARINNLDEIPSPFLTGIFDNRYSMSVIETNRGCPFRCGFCFWGAATNDRVYRFDEQRIRDEVSWMARNDILFLYIADANWGMLARDVDISNHIAECSRSYGVPNVIYFSAAKNKPHAVTKITSIFQDAGLIASQPVSLQTIEPRSLDLIRRTNIKLSAFSAVQRDLREKSISSFIELIWPLPGETLGSFKSGIGSLCENDAQTIIAYPHLLLHNTPLEDSAQTHGLITRDAGGTVGEAKVVVATKDVSAADFRQGMRYFYAVHALHNTRSLSMVARYLVSRAVLSYAELFSAFVDFWASLPDSDPIVSYVERSIRDADYYDINNYGLFIHSILHEHRATFSNQICSFVKTQAWWDDDTIRPLLEIDLLNRPYVYSNTTLETHEESLQIFAVNRASPRSYGVRVPHGQLATLIGLIDPEIVPADGLMVIDHKRMQYPFMTAQSLAHNGSYCHGMIEKIESIMPLWRLPKPNELRSWRSAGHA